MCRHIMTPEYRPVLPSDDELPVPKDVHLDVGGGPQGSGLGL